MHGLLGAVSEKHWSGETRLLSFVFKLGLKPAKQTRTQVFVPLPQEDVEALKAFLRANEKSETDEIGHVSLTVGPTRIHWKRFYPLGQGDTNIHLRKRGIGSRVHHVEHLADHYREREIYHSSVTEERKAQLHAMEIYPTFDRLPIEMYREKVRIYMTRKFGMQFR